MNPLWDGRGSPWDYDPGPPRNRSWPRLFAATPNYRGLGLADGGRERFRWHFGPLYYRGRLGDGQVKVLVIGQEGAQDESLSRRAFTGSSGARMQHFLDHIGITRSYLFLNTFVYTIFGQYGSALRDLAQNPESPIVRHRHRILDYALARNDIRLVVAVGTAAKETVVTWVESRGGSCPAGARDVSACDGQSLGPRTRVIGVRHPGGGREGGTAPILRDFRRAAAKIAAWARQDPGWLVPDAGAAQRFGERFEYRRAPIPFRDLAFGTAWRLGHGATASNRKDAQRSIQIFSANGRYAEEEGLDYRYRATGSREGYAEEPGDLPYEPPRHAYRDYDRGPGRRFARLFMGGAQGLAWPDFTALGANAHPSFGNGGVYRGRPNGAHVLVLADQQSHDDVFTGRALTGDAGQHLQAFLAAMGITRSYLIVRVLPVDTLGLARSRVADLLAHPQTLAVYQAIVDRVRARNPRLTLCLACGRHARSLAGRLDLGDLRLREMKAWRERGALADWQAQLAGLALMRYPKDLRRPDFAYDGRRSQIPRIDLPYGLPRWVGSSGSRASRPAERDTGDPSRDYYKLYMPRWAYRLSARPLSAAEREALRRMDGAGPSA